METNFVCSGILNRLKLILRYLLLIRLILFVESVQAQKYYMAQEDLIEVRRRLTDYAKGAITLEQVVEPDGEEWGKKLIGFYVLRTNEVSAKMKLPIARAYSSFGSYSNSVQLASDYLAVYTNDARGWDVLSGAHLMQRSYNEALAAGTNAIRLGSERNIAGVGGIALHTERMDVLEGVIVPRLLVLKGDSSTAADSKQSMLSVLVAYSLKAKKKEIFVKALEGVDAKLIIADPKLKANVELGCEYFDAKETEKLCSRLKQVKAAQ